MQFSNFGTEESQHARLHLPNVEHKGMEALQEPHSTWKDWS